MQTNKRPSIVPTGTNDSAPSAQSNNTITARRSGHQVLYVVFFCIQRPMAPKEYPTRILSTVHVRIWSMRSCLRCKTRIQCLTS
jgi:hypothetical protein